MKKAKETAIFEGKTELNKEELLRFSEEYDKIMNLADVECPRPPDSQVKKKGRKKKGTERSLIERL